VANVYSADPASRRGPRHLEDPKGLFLASHVVPLVDESFRRIADVINKVSAALTEGPVALNVEATSTRSPKDIARLAGSRLS
jgi:osmoprotectant transport system substrate-binding protein